MRKADKNGIINYILDLKKQGVVRHVGLSSHTPELAGRVLDMGILGMLMFSINPGYDYQKGSYGIGSVKERPPPQTRLDDTENVSIENEKTRYRG